jgi:16S rRNA G1207 methylase RsmC
MAEAHVVLAIFTDDSFGAEFSAAQRLGPGMITFKTLEAFKLAKHVLADKSFDQVIVYTKDSASFDQQSLNSLVKVLKPGGSLRVTSQNQHFEEGFQKKLIMAGLTDFENTSNGVLKANRKVWKVEQRPIDSQVKEQPKNAFAAALTQTSKGEKIDPESLLKDDVITEADKGGSCDTKPKACKNCTCGRKEME